MKIVLVVGAATPPGRLNKAVEHLASTLTARAETDIASLAARRIEICDGRPFEQYDAATRDTVAAIAAAQGVVFAAPVYRASFPGVLKNLLDLLPVEALRDKPVGIVAMGATPHHFLGVDSHLRMVLAWFGALTLPNSVYLTNRDFAEGKLASDSAAADLAALGDAVVTLADAVAGKTLGPTPLAARFT
jgi:FMN reductase